MLGTSTLDNMQRDIYVATSYHKDELGGQVITWVTHASLVPEKRNVICVFSKFNHTYRLLKNSRKFALNLLKENQVELASMFGLKSGNDVSKFTEEINYEAVDNLPILKNTCGYSILRVIKEVDLGDRVVVISRVEKEFFNNAALPLKLNLFLKGLSPDQIEMQKKNYEEMVKRDAPLIKEEI